MINRPSETSRAKIIAGIPAYNESDHITDIVLDARKYVDEVVVIDDGSSDDTAEKAAQAGAVLVRHPYNRGYGASIQDIFTEARKRNPDVLVILDADGQHDPHEIPHLVKPVLDGYDFVVGSRQKQSGKIPLYRRMGQRFILGSVKMLTPHQLTDSECGFRAFSRRAVNSLDLKEEGMAISAETVAEAARKRLKTTEVPVTAIYHKDSSTLNPFSHGLSVITRIIVMISERRPLFFFGLAGLVLFALGLGAGIFALNLYTRFAEVSVGWALIAAFFIIIGIFCIFTGLILHTMSSIIRNALSGTRK
jgi:glycosyltransferase involved in cell wall biosynthesis